MARDYKNRSSRKPAVSPLAGLLTFVAGLVTGLCLAVGFVLLQGLPDMLAGARQQQPVVITTAPGSDKAADEPGDGTNTESGEAAKPTPKFDFYTILPEMEVSVPEWESPTEEQPAETTAATPASNTDTEAESYLLQIGSFQQPDEAERVKARLALLGIHTEIQRVTIDGGDVWHRVRAGPYQDATKLEQLRQLLIENDIDFMLMKLK